MAEIEDKKVDNKWLLEKELEALKLFYERNLLTKEQYDFEVKTLTEKNKDREIKDIPIQRTHFYASAIL